MFIAFDSLRFYKLKSENTARILFLVLYALILFAYAFPIGEALTLDYLADSIRQYPQTWPEQLKISHFINLIALMVLQLITAFISLIYANCLVMEREGFPAKKAVITAFRYLPRLALFLLMLLLPLLISGFFIFIPFIFIYYMMFFVPLLITEGRKSIPEAIRESYRITRGFRLSIFSTQMMLYFIVNVPMSLVMTAFLASGNENTLAEHLLMSFLRAAQILISGRMLGNFYFYLVKRNGKNRDVYFSFIRPEQADSGSDSSESDEKSNEDKSYPSQK